MAVVKESTGDVVPMTEPQPTLVPVHPEPVVDDERSLRWSVPAGTLAVVGVPAALPAAVQGLLDQGVLESVSVEPAAVRTRLGIGRSWRADGAEVRTALQMALATPEQWRVAGGPVPADELLRAAAQQVVDGEVGDYIRSHGGRVEVLTARDDEVEVQLSGACRHCPASDVTLTDRLEAGIRALYPRLRGLTARSERNLGGGRRMLRLLPTRDR